MSEWISVEDRLPSVIGSYLTFYSGDTIGFMFLNSRKEWICGNSRYKSITHWQPLPEPPK